VSSFKVGNAEVTSVLDLAFAFPYNVAYPLIPAEQWEPYRSIYPKCWDSQGNWATNAQAFLIRTAGQTVLVDAGMGPGPNQGAGGAMGNLGDNLRAQGVRPEDVNIVIFTHLHFDHTGWAVVDGKPFCPNARYLCPEADWQQLGNTGALFAEQPALKPLQDAGKVELVSGEKSVTPEISVTPTPGHTPGHQSVVIASAGERGMILGDLFNHPAQVQETDWNAGFDFDQAGARVTRKAAFERLEQQGIIVANGHYPAPGFGRIVREGGRRIFRAL
jgi:glyoxylase-like metal-dependent hydrolase (beta-lactamase superfamily II)